MLCCCAACLSRNLFQMDTSWGFFLSNHPFSTKKLFIHTKRLLWELRVLVVGHQTTQVETLLWFGMADCFPRPAHPCYQPPLLKSCSHTKWIDTIVSHAGLRLEDTVWKERREQANWLRKTQATGQNSVPQHACAPERPGRTQSPSLHVPQSAWLTIAAVCSGQWWGQAAVGDTLAFMPQTKLFLSLPGDRSVWAQTVRFVGPVWAIILAPRQTGLILMKWITCELWAPALCWLCFAFM